MQEGAVEKFIEAEVCDMMKEILVREMTKLHKKEAWVGVDYTGFEKLSKVYAMLKDDLREDLKADIYSKLNKLTAA